jgi:hydrogenase maturation protease
MKCSAIDLSANVMTDFAMEVPHRSVVRNLVIGFGNTLRGDDGAGYYVAETVAQWCDTAVKSIYVHQLTLDLAAEIADHQRVIFIDAVPYQHSGYTQCPTVIIQPLQADVYEPGRNSYGGHYSSPSALLAVAQHLYGVKPIAYQLLIPAADFSFGDKFSDVTTSCVKLALAKVKELLDLSAS